MEKELIFDCSGKAFSSDCHLPGGSLLTRGDLGDIFKVTSCVPHDVDLFSNVRPFSTGIFHLKHLLKLTELNLKIFCRFENAENLTQKLQFLDFYKLRKEILTFVRYAGDYFMNIEWHQLQHGPMTELTTGFDEVLFTLQQFFPRLYNIPSSTFQYAASSISRKSPEFHLFHLHLELRWMTLILILKKTTCCQEKEDHNDKLNRIIELTIQDMIFISLKIFERVDYSDLKHKNPFSCSCVKDLWLCLQVIVDKISKDLDNKNFWYYVNNILDIIMKNEGGRGSEVLWNGFKKPKCNLDSKNPELFSLWMIYHLNLLYGYSQDGFYEGISSSRLKPNFEEVEEIFKNYLAKGGKEGERDQIDEELRFMIPFIKTLILDYWKSKQNSLKVVNFLWECFHRRLDQPFLIQTAGPWSISLEKKTPKDMLKQVKDRIFETADSSCKESSYGMFLRLLGIVLHENYSQNDLKIWNQVKGRIYSKFPKGKIQKFSEIKLFNQISIFLTLAVTADAINVCNVLLDLLPSVLEIDSDNSKKSVLNWKAQLCCLLIYSEKKLNLQPIAEKLRKIVDTLPCKRDEISKGMMTTFVETLSEIVSNLENFDNGENLLIGGWVDRFLAECPKNRAGTMLNVIWELLLTSRRLDVENVGRKEMLEILWTSVIGRIRSLVYDNDLVEENCLDIGKIAAYFTLEALRCPKTAETHRQSLTSLLRHFTSTIYVKDVKISRIYLSVILENREAVKGIKKAFQNFDLLVIQVWIKCSILGQDTCMTEMKPLKNYVLNLHDVEKVFPSWKDSLEFKTSKESVILYANAIAARRSGLTEPERIAMDKKTRLIFSTLDKWILNTIKEDNKDSVQAFFIYRCLGTIILTCSSALHSTTQGSLLRTLIAKSMLPSEENNYLKHLGTRIFSMILLGLGNLNFKDDIILQKMIIEIFNIYLPLLITEVDKKRFKVAEQLMKFFQEAKREFLIVIFQKLSTVFLAFNGNELNKNSYLVMELLRHLLTLEEQKKDFIDLITEKCMPNVLESYLKVHDLHPHRTQTVDLISALCKNDYCMRERQVRENVKTTMRLIICSKVKDYPHGCFELVKCIIIIDRSIGDEVILNIDKIINEMEINFKSSAASLKCSLRRFKEFSDQILLGANQKR